MRTAVHLALVAAVAAVAGCGEREAAAPAPPRTTGSADLVVEVRPGGESAAVRTHRVRCPGDPRCARLERDGVDLFDPVPPATACTEIFGGPQSARVRGTLSGERVDARFSRANGCEIARWDRVDFLLVAAP